MNKLTKKYLRQLLNNNDYAVLDIHIYDNGKQADVIARDKMHGNFRAYIITLNEVNNADKFVNCHYEVFGIEKFFNARLLV